MILLSSFFRPSSVSRSIRTAITGVGLLCATSLWAAPGDYTRDTQGITLETSTGLTRVEVWKDRTIRVLHTPTKQLPAITSLAVKSTPAATSWQFQNNGGSLLVTTPNVTVRVQSPGGQVQFLGSDSTTILAESAAGTSLQATTVGNPAAASYVVTQKFDLPSGEAIYGLGQHQQGVMNYVGQSVTLLQKKPRWPFRWSFPTGATRCSGITRR